MGAFKPSMLLFLVTISVLLLSSSYTPIAQARVERQLFVLQLVKVLANGAARVGQHRLWKAAEKVILKFFGPEVRSGFEYGEKIAEFIDTMKDISNQQCNTSFCINHNLLCEPCTSNSSFRVSCQPYCVLKWIDDNTLSCKLPCGPPAEDDGGASPSPSPNS